MGLGCLFFVFHSQVSFSEDSDGQKSVLAPGEKAAGLYATSMQRGDYETIISHNWARGGLFRSETIVTGHQIVTIVNRDQYYTYDGLTGEGYQIHRSQAARQADSERERPFANELAGILKAGGELIREETFNGIDVQIFQVTNQKGRSTLTVTADVLQIPVRLEMFERRTGKTSRVDWISWSPGLVIEDSFFEVPEQIRLRKFSSYEDFVAKSREEPVPPVQPVFLNLLYAPAP